MVKKELKVALFLAWRSMVRGNRSSVLLNVLIISMVFTNMMFFPALMAGIGVDIKEQVVTYQTSNIVIEPAREDCMVLPSMRSSRRRRNTYPRSIRR
jgi:putative ABC transport system permease protein